MSSIKAEYTAPTSAGKSDLVLVSSDGLDFHVHLKQLECASDLVLDMVSSSTSDANEAGQVTLQLSNEEYETAETLALAIPFCYNVYPPDLQLYSVEVVRQVMAMATKWGMHRVVKASVDSLIIRAAGIDPKISMQIYIHACRFQLQGLREATMAQAALDPTFVANPFVYLSELGISDSSILYQLHSKKMQCDLEQAQSRLEWTKKGSKACQEAIASYIAKRPQAQPSTGMKGYGAADRTLRKWAQEDHLDELVEMCMGCEEAMNFSREEQG